jgi:hypothetical protein
MTPATEHPGGRDRRSRSVARVGGRALTLALALALLAGAVHAHATLVFGVVRVAPDPPAPGEAFTLTLTLEDPSLTPVEDAIVFVELRPMPAVDAPLPDASTEAPDLPPPLRSERLIEVAPAVYQTEISLPDGASYHLLVRDQTFQWEEANASVVLPLLGRPVGDLPFILPPTQVAPRSLWTWIVWLVGLPLLAGVVVTLLVLRSQPPAAKRTEDGA